MRLMLGIPGNPTLLVSQDQVRSATDFEFWVFNGAWRGTYNNGHVTVHDAPSGSFSSLDKVSILCYNQDRLRGSYETVFDNFDNVDYVAPDPVIVQYTDMDDDIAF
jgi:hypothetical protein